MASQLFDWLIMAALALVFNALPAFAPPTAAVLAWYHAGQGLPLVAVALVGASAATAGRLLLALAARRLGPRIVPEARREGLDEVAVMLRERRALGVASVAMFAVGPVPKAWLFMAAGIARLPLLPGALAYFVARFVIYLSTVAALDVGMHSLRDVLGSQLGGPLAIATQLVGLAGTILLFKLDWSRLLRRVAALQRPATDPVPASVGE